MNKSDLTYWSDWSPQPPLVLTTGVIAGIVLVLAYMLVLILVGPWSPDTTYTAEICTFKYFWKQVWEHKYTWWCCGRVEWSR